jgi:hypothetical protein
MACTLIGGGDGGTGSSTGSRARTQRPRPSRTVVYAGGTCDPPTAPSAIVHPCRTSSELVLIRVRLSDTPRAGRQHQTALPGDSESAAPGISKRGMEGRTAPAGWWQRRIGRRDGGCCRRTTSPLAPCPDGGGVSGDGGAADGGSHSDHEDDAARVTLRGFLERIVIPPGDGLLQVVGNLGNMLTAASGRSGSVVAAVAQDGCGGVQPSVLAPVERGGVRRGWERSSETGPRVNRIDYNPRGGQT